MPIPNDPNRLAINAICAADAAEILFLVGNATAGQADAIVGPSFIGGTILGSFGIELLLKSINSILNADNSFPSGHKLSNLFDAIPDNALKQAIESEFTTQTGKALADFNTTHENAFVEWRYFGESDDNLNFDSAACRELTKILKSKVRALSNSD